jgi:hypothetical protein
MKTPVWLFMFAQDKIDCLMEVNAQKNKSSPNRQFTSF